MTKFVYFFGANKTEGTGKMKELLGGKGAGLAEMTSLGIPVPAGFTITTEVCTYFNENKNTYPTTLEDEVSKVLKLLEEAMGTKFGDASNPLLLSVRSGARVSMPGMMDTVLNLGLNDETVEGLAKKTGNPRFAYDSYRRFIQMFSDVVLDVDHAHFEKILENKKASKNIHLDTDLTSDDLKDIVVQYKEAVKKALGKDFPSDPKHQLWESITAVFRSWNTRRAVDYRKINQIPDNWGTAVNVQAMVFGNMGNDCATGVAFTRDPSTGEKKFFGEYLVNAQGEDVVAGIRTPLPMSDGSESLEKIMPPAYKTLLEIQDLLERHYKDMQDIEFTIQNNKVWMLQTRSGKRTGTAAVRIAVEMVKEGILTQKEAVMRVSPSHLDQILHPTLDPKAKKEVLAKGLPASPGAAVGRVVFSADEAQEWAERGEKVILVRQETSPEDIHGMHAAEGVLTARGGMTSHAAVVARGMGKCCVSGCGDILIDHEKELFRVGEHTIKKGEWLTLDGTLGEVLDGKVPTVQPELTGDFGEFMKWVDQYRRLKVRTNADTPHDSKIARQFGAEGIGLCRTEHMFFEPDRIDAVREMILANNRSEREKALTKILPMQKGDFKSIFREMKGFPVTIRLLDPPLHEFLPHTDEEIKELAKKIGVSHEKLKAKTDSLHEMNPMLGHRGCRLGITFPEIYQMQVRAIMEAACELAKDEDFKIIPEIMIPLVGHVNELKRMRDDTEQVCKQVIEEKKCSIEYLIGTMIELPRAALTADQIGKQADFFSFGTNDLTQTTFGFSRDDAGKFLPFYVDKGILPCDPFTSLDQDGVGALVKMGFEKGRSVKEKLKVGICGEHGGDPASIEFCHKTGLDYVSCSPYRVPIARLAAAQATLKQNA
ncbi:MAG: pyruvate, phosphate dikinase [Deltaproteobacteria bacterium]|nr:MAG: pyruvate, phosphate dikinase [Deltaproteobacteria bacterium]